MQTITQRVEAFFERRPDANIIEEPEALRWLLEAVRKYDGFGELEHHYQQRITHEEAIASGAQPGALVLAPIDENLPISNGEWTTIEPLWMLYMERERASLIEAGRMMGDMSFGRTTSEIAQEINIYEEGLHLKAFSMDCYTV